MKARTILVAASFQCALAVMAVGAGAIATAIAAGCMAEAVAAWVESERED